MKALIIDTQELYRLSLKEVVTLTAPFKKIVEASNEKEFLTLTAKETNFDLILITPHQLGEGSKWLHLAHRLYPTAALVAFYNRDKPSGLMQADTKCEMLPRDTGVQQLMTCLRRILRLTAVPQGHYHGERPVPNILSALEKNPTLSGSDSERQPPEMSRLSFRQRQILAMAADGLPNKEIAARLEIAEGTVKAHMHAIFKVLGVTNRTQAVLQYSGTRRQTGFRSESQSAVYATA